LFASGGDKTLIKAKEKYIKKAGSLPVRRAFWRASEMK